MDDFERVAVAHLDIVQCRTRHHLQIMLDRHLERIDPDLAKHSRDAAPGGDLPRLAVHLDRDPVLLGGISHLPKRALWFALPLI